MNLEKDAGGQTSSSFDSLPSNKFDFESGNKINDKSLKPPKPVSLIVEECLENSSIHEYFQWG
jgi:hypothetical protein